MRGSLAVLAVALAVAGPASGQVLYKWTDANGRVQYSDKPPKDFKGPVTRIEGELPTQVPLLPKAVDGRPAQAAPAPPAQDVARQRRERREQLHARLEGARAKADAARKALDEGREIREGDHQFVQQRVKDAGTRVNCRKVKDSAGKEALVCGTPVPNVDYQQRVERLETELKAAEDALAEAEAAYRRGVD